MPDLVEEDDDDDGISEYLREDPEPEIEPETSEGIPDVVLDTFPKASPSISPSAVEDEDDEEVYTPESIMEAVGVRQETDAADILYAWMRYHEFVIVQSIDQLEDIVDRAIKAGACSLDLETDGLDNRIYWHNPDDIIGPFEEFWDGERPAQIPLTIHKIVGYCLCYDGHTGYYVPVRHRDESGKLTSENMDLVQAGNLIKKLCKASQPELQPEGFKDDPLGSAKLKRPPKVKIFFHHAKFDQEFLYPVTGIDFWHPESFDDSLLMYYCLNTGDKSLGLKYKSETNLFVQDAKGNKILAKVDNDPKNPLHQIVTEDPKRGTPIPYKMIELKELFIKGRKIEFSRLSPEEARRYACSDAICTYLHCTKPDLVAAMNDGKFRLTYRLERQVSQVLRWMERNRIKIDHEYVKSLFEEARIEADGYREEILAAATGIGWNNFDPNSTQQLSEFFFNAPNGLNIEPKPDKNEKSGQYKTDADTLEELVKENADINPILMKLVKYRQVEKVIGTYLEGMLNNCDSNSELRYQFKQTGAPTGRFTAPSGDPAHGYGGIPIHGIPSTYDEKKPKVATALRRAFIARHGYTMVKIDFAGEELRIVTNLSREPVWIKEFLHGTGDLHTITAKAFFGDEITKQQRQMGKMANFSLVYGGSTMAIMRATKCSQQEAARRKKSFDDSMPKFAEWVKHQKQKIKKDLGVFTAFGRWMAVPNANSEDRAIAAACERYSLNYPIQGSGADVMKIALVLLYKEFYKRGWLKHDIARFMLTVHDEIVFEVKHENLQEVMPVLEHCMTSPCRLPRPAWEVPLEVEPLIDLHWDPHYDYHKIMHGSKSPDKKLKGDYAEFQMGDRWYQPIPPWLQGHLKPDYMNEGSTPQQPPPAAAPTETPSAPTSGAPKESVPGSSKVEATPSTPPTSKPVSKPPAPVSKPVETVSTPKPKLNGNDVINYGLSVLTSDNVVHVYSICFECRDSKGPLLCLFDQVTNDILIDPSLGVRVDASAFKFLMRGRGL